MQILNIGSINIDHVYAVNHFVRPGETLDSAAYNIFAGGKGFNQSIALARAGASTRHAGRIAKHDDWLLRRLQKEGIDTEFVNMDDDSATGHAIIQVVPSGENAIVLHGGANQRITEKDILGAVSACSPGDYVLLQNETSSVTNAIRISAERGLRIVFNPAPMTAAVREYPLELVNIFVLNETEAAELTGKTAPEDVRAVMSRKHPRAATVLTRGSAGADYFSSDCALHEPAITVEAVDTTAAGDTFIGFFLAELVQSNDAAGALAAGCRAAAICITRPGASDSIPSLDETRAQGTQVKSHKREDKKPNNST